MESWRKVWRDGYAPLLSTEQLQALLRGLANDDPRLVQGATTSPPPLMCVQDWPVEAADAIGYCGVSTLGGFGTDPDNLGLCDPLTPATVGEVEEFWARAAFECDQRLREPAACRYFLNWFDDTPRDEMRRLLAEEIQLALAARPS